MNGYENDMKQCMIQRKEIQSWLNRNVQPQCLNIRKCIHYNANEDDNVLTDLLSLTQETTTYQIWFETHKNMDIKTSASKKQLYRHFRRKSYNKWYLKWWWGSAKWTKSGEEDANTTENGWRRNKKEKIKLIQKYKKDERWEIETRGNEREDINWK